MIKTITFSVFFLLLNSLHAQVLLKDLNPTGSSGAFIFGNLGDTLLIYGSDGVTGSEPWYSDGSESGTFLLKDIQTGAAKSSFPTYYTKVGKNYFFVAAHSGSLIISLWKTDGTPNGTSQVKDLGAYPIPQGGGQISAMLMKEFNGKLYFVYESAEGKELWTSDGTSNGTEILKDINSGSNSSSPSGLIVFKNHLYFFANDGSNGNELWRTDGTSNGTQLFKDIYAGAISSFPTGIPAFFIFKDHLYFGAQGDHDEGIELYRTDGTSNGTELFLDINTDIQGSSFPALVGIAENYFVFRASTANSGHEAWVSDGTINNTKLLMDITPGTSGSFPGVGIELNGKIIFPASETTQYGYELWVTDGTSVGTKILKDINPNTASGYSGYITKFGNRIFFAANDNVNGIELWETNGTEFGTKMHKDLNPGAPSSSVSNLYVVNDRLYFSAAVVTGDREIYWLSPGMGSSINKLNNSKVSIYPNPVLNGQSIFIDESQVQVVNLIDMHGRKIQLTQNPDTTWFIPETLATGCYTLQIISENMVSNQTLIVQ